MPTIKQSALFRYAEKVGLEIICTGGGFDYPARRFGNGVEATVSAANNDGPPSRLHDAACVTVYVNDEWRDGVSWQVKNRPRSCRPGRRNGRAVQRMTAYYNEHDPHAAQWLRHMIIAGLIVPGDVDERSILDVRPDELRGYTQCHFFAGVGVWSYALRRAGWPDDRPVWTGSCPCQPFSAAGRRAGFADERHLWPAWFHLIRFGKPDAVPVLGEQVASNDGLAWLDVVQADMEGAGYACAAGFGAPHIRQRLYFAAERLGNAVCTRLEGYSRHEHDRGESGRFDAHAAGSVAAAGAAGGERRQRPGSVNGFWSGADWLGCRDGKFRPVEPGTFPLVNGASGRVGRLRAYGNGLCAAQAQAFIEAFMECRP